MGGGGQVGKRKGEGKATLLTEKDTELVMKTIPRPLVSTTNLTFPPGTSVVPRETLGLGDLPDLHPHCPLPPGTGPRLSGKLLASQPSCQQEAKLFRHEREGRWPLLLPANIHCRMLLTIVLATILQESQDSSNISNL